MKKILFVNPGPFGSLTDTYFYYLNLKDIYDITYIGLNAGNNIPKYPDINIIHLEISGNVFKQKILFLFEIYKLLKKNNDYCFILVNYFLGCSLINVFKRKNLIIDVRTSVISESKYITFFSNMLLSLEVSSFRQVSCISESLVEYLNLPKCTHILPLGAPSFPFIKKDFTTLKILYVGTFHQREIVKTIYGFFDFISKYDNKEIATYSIIGHGTDMDIKNIQDSIIQTGMQNHIFFKGTIRYPELNNYLKECNVGFSYIPIKKCFDNQPPTKTFEYLLSGMIVLATGTKENKKVIGKENGFIIDDEIKDIADGLQYIYNNRYNYSSEIIQKKSQKYSWENIIKSNLNSYIEKFN